MAKIESFYLEGNTEYAVLMCHPLAETSDMMLPFAKRLQKKGYTVSCPLYEGHGLRFEDMIQSDFNVWYNQLKDEYKKLSETYKVFICGMSLGGSMTVKLAEEFDPQAVATINAPIIGFDCVSDFYGFKSNFQLDTMDDIYKEHRQIYFEEVVKLGQIEELKKIKTPFFVLQGSLDAPRYKTSSHMLMTYINSDVKQRKDYKKGRHLMLLGEERKQVMKDIYKFFEENK